jgi:hypothetical protein
MLQGYFRAEYYAGRPDKNCAILHNQIRERPLLQNLDYAPTPSMSEMLGCAVLLRLLAAKKLTWDCLSQEAIIMSHVQEPPDVQWRPECVICKESVKLEESKSDEHGQAIHEDCYVSTVIRKSIAA